MRALELMATPVAVAEAQTLRLRYGNAAFVRWQGGTLPASIADLVADFDEVAFVRQLNRRGAVELTGEAVGPGNHNIAVRFRVHAVELPDGPALLIEGIDDSKVVTTRAMFEEYVKLLESRCRLLERKLARLGPDVDAA